MRNVTRKIMMAAAGVVLTATSASAQQLNFVGSAELANQPGNATNLWIDFVNGSTVGTTGGTVTAVPTTTFPGITTGTMGVIQDLIVGPSGVTNVSTGNGVTGAATPIANFLTIGGYTFSLTSSSTGGTFGYGITLSQNDFGTSALFGVSGEVSGAGVAAGTTYTGLFTAQFLNQTPEQVFTSINNGATVPVSFSATFGASTVPEPSTYMLLATGIGALGLVARRRRTNV